jgi:dTDP-4-amino-4,6-dideoxygalactose transaminase
MHPETKVSDQEVPLADPRGDHAAMREEILQAVAQVFDGGYYILGPREAAFEQEMAGRLGVQGTVGVSSGTDALVLALLALGVGSGDEVITVSHTAGPTVAAIKMINAIPVLIDVDSESYCLDPKGLDAAIGPRTKAILAVHLYGHPADLDAICAFSRRHGVQVVEDCAQAQGALYADKPVGSIGDAGCFSFYPTKNLGALGDGGMVATSRLQVIERLRQIRTYGWTQPQYAEIPGGRCARLDELQAAILSVKLKHLDRAITRRRAIAARYAAELSDLPLVLPVEKARAVHAYHLYVIRSDRRVELTEHLKRAGIMTGQHYPFAVHRQPALAAGARIPQPLSTTEGIASEILTLPLFASMSNEQQARVIAATRSFFGRS